MAEENKNRADGSPGKLTVSGIPKKAFSQRNPACHRSGDVKFVFNYMIHLPLFINGREKINQGRRRPPSKRGATFLCFPKSREDTEILSRAKSLYEVWHQWSRSCACSKRAIPASRCLCGALLAALRKSRITNVPEALPRSQKSRPLEETPPRRTPQSRPFCAPCAGTGRGAFPCAAWPPPDIMGVLQASMTPGAWPIL